MIPFKIRMSLQRKIGTMLILLLAVSIIEIVGIRILLRQQQADALVINIAGRQRMLSQGISKYALLIEKQDNVALENLASTSNLFDQSLQSLIAGDDELGIPPASEQVQPVLQLLRDDWTPFYTNVQALRDATPGDLAFDDALNYIVDNNEELLARADSVTAAFQVESEQKTDRLEILLNAIIVVALVIFGFSIVTLRRVVAPITYLAEAATDISSGNLGRRVHVNTGDEIELLANQFNFMSAELQKSFAELEQRVEERTAEIQLLLDMTKSVNAAPDFQTALNIALKSVVQHTGWIFGEAWIPNAVGTILKSSGSSYYKDSTDKLLQEFAQESESFTFAPDVGLPGRIWASQQPEWNQDTSELSVEVYHRAELVQKTGLRAAAGVPIIADDETLAVLVFYMGEPRSQDPHLVEVITAVAIQLNAEFHRKRSEAALRLRIAALEAAPNGIVIATNQGAIIWVNSAFTKLTGYTVEEVVSQKMSLFKSEMHPPSFYEDIWDTILTKKRWHGEVINQRKDGSIYTEEQAITPIYDDHGVITHFVASKQDVTQRKKDEEILHQAKEDAEMASRAKSDFLARVSHELRTPLGVVLGYTEYLQGGRFGRLSEKQQEAIGKVANSTHHLTEMVGDLLDQAQIEARTIRLEIAPFVLAEMVNQVMREMEILAQKKGLTLITEITVDVPTTLLGDDTRLRQILINLVSNAIKFTDVGTVQIQIFCPDTDYWAMQVSDTGIGISAEAQDYIFDAFQQVENAVTRAYAGTGLGLAIVKQLTIIMGGEITLESEPGRGSIFTVLFPTNPLLQEETT